jgi:hypothetical protein
MPLRKGLYRAYNGRLFCVLELAHHSETGQRLVIMARDTSNVQAMPIERFNGTITINGRELPMFMPVPGGQHGEELG